MADSKSTTPQRAGYRWPAEWEPQAAVWMAWPHDKSVWEIELDPIWDTFADLISELANVQRVNLLVPNDDIRRDADRHLDAGQRRRKTARRDIQFVTIDTDDCWLRDIGPIFLNRNGEQAAVCWKFNGWGKFEPYAKDALVPTAVAHHCGIPFWEPGIIFEGGAIDGNGDGVALTTEQCLLADNRNPKLTKEDYERILREHLGVTQLIWLGNGLFNDHTDGHVDVITRFVDPKKVVTLMTDDTGDPSYEALADNFQRLQAVRIKASPLEIVRLPLPDPVFLDSKQLAAGYANFVIANGLIIVPTYNCTADGKAIDILKGLFPDRKVIGLDATELLKGGGAFHCVTQQQPAARKTP